jgi:5-dehydro-4-deoxyglucarate dehydratase
MEPGRLKTALGGVIAFAVTPFTSAEDLDLDGLERNIDFLSRSGVSTVVVCGGVGEFFSITTDEFDAFVQSAVRSANHRVTVLAGIGYSTRVACDLAERAAKAGVDGLMINPFYFVNPTDDGIVEHYRRIGQASHLGMMAFSTKSAVYGPALLERLAEVEEVIALKDEYGDLRLFIKSIELLGDRFVWVNGCAEILAAPYFAAGAHAFTSGIVNFAPQISLDIWTAGAAGRWDDVRHLIATAAGPLAELRERRPGYAIAIVKEAMNMLGMAGGTVRSPLRPVAPADRESLRKTLHSLNLIGAYA